MFWLKRNMLRGSYFSLMRTSRSYVPVGVYANFLANEGERRIRDAYPAIPVGASGAGRGST